jgi:hypothetical protein
MKWPPGRRATTQGPATLLASIERECREQHAAYLARRDELNAVARRAANAMSASLVGRRSPVRMKLSNRSARRLRLVAGDR